MQGKRKFYLGLLSIAGFFFAVVVAGAEPIALGVGVGAILTTIIYGNIKEHQYKGYSAVHDSK